MRDNLIMSPSLVASQAILAVVPSEGVPLIRSYRDSLLKQRRQTAKMSSETITSRFCNHYSIIPSPFAFKMSTNYPGGIKLIRVAWRWKYETKHLAKNGHKC